MTATRLATNGLGATGLEVTRVGLERLVQVDPDLPAAKWELSDEDVTELEGSEQ